MSSLHLSNGLLMSLTLLAPDSCGLFKRFRHLDALLVELLQLVVLSGKLGLSVLKLLGNEGAFRFEVAYLHVQLRLEFIDLTFSFFDLLIRVRELRLCCLKRLLRSVRSLLGLCKIDLCLFEIAASFCGLLFTVCNLCLGLFESISVVFLFLLCCLAELASLLGLLSEATSELSQPSLEAVLGGLRFDD